MLNTAIKNNISNYGISLDSDDEDSIDNGSENESDDEENTNPNSDSESELGSNINIITDETRYDEAYNLLSMMLDETQRHMFGKEYYWNPMAFRNFPQSSQVCRVSKKIRGHNPTGLFGDCFFNIFQINV